MTKLTENISQMSSFQRNPKECILVYFNTKPFMSYENLFSIFF